MDQKVIIRTVEKTDSGQIINLMKCLANQTKYMLREPYEVNENIVEQENRIEAMINDPNVMYLIAEEDDVIVGILIASSKNLERIKHVGDFIVGLHNEYWGRGIASKLMDELVKWATKTCLKRLTCEVVEENESAIRLYEKYGFQVEGKKIADHYIGNDVYLNTLVMGKLLNL